MAMSQLPEDLIHLISHQNTNKRRFVRKPNKSSMAMPNWAELPTDLIHLIAQRIKVIEDFIAFRAVCASWRTSITNSSFDSLSPQIPLLMLADKDDDYREFYSLSKKKVSRIFLPEVRARECYPTQGWICTVEFQTTEMNLLHPFSRINIQLPSEKELWALAGQKFPDPQFRMRYQCMSKAVLSASPSVTSDYVLAVSYYAQLSYVACWRPGDLNWICVHMNNSGGVSSMIYHKRLFYCVTYTGEIWAFGVPGRSIPQPIVVKAAKLVSIENRICQNRNYLVELSGALLIIFRFVEDDTFGVHEIDVTKGELKEINTLGDYAVFVGLNGAIAIDSSKFTARVKSNHIYFTDDEEEEFHHGDGGGTNMGAYNLQNGNVESFYPEVSLSHICPPTWVTPSFS